MTPWGARFGSGVVLAIDTRAPCRATSLAGVARALGGVAAMSLANSVPLLALGTITLVQLSCYIEEWIFKALPGFKFHWFVALVELLLFAVAGRIGQGFSSPQPPRRGPLYLYAGVGFTLSLGTGLGKVAFRYLNYATGTVLKSMKLLPVLAISACWLKRQYTPGEVIAAVLMVISASLFGLGERELEPSFHPLGIALSLHASWRRRFNPTCRTHCYAIAAATCTRRCSIPTRWDSSLCLLSRPRRANYARL